MSKVKKRHATFFVYIVRCCDQSLYCGFTTNLENRITQHNTGKGAKYLRGRGPVSVVWKREYKYLRCALKKEAAIKKLHKLEKEALIAKSPLHKKNQYNFQRKQCKIFIQKGKS